MQCAKDIHYAQPSAKNNSFILNEFSISIREKIMASVKATFEGIGMAGLISAAFWYITAPMAPDGFKGPISTFIITVSTIATLLIAIPIAYVAYKEIAKKIAQSYNELYLESQYLMRNHPELHYELLQLRSLFDSDDEFKIHINPIARTYKEIINETVMASVCEIFGILKNKRYHLKWHGATLQFPVLRESPNNFNSIGFKKVIKNKCVTNNKLIRKALVNIVEQCMTKQTDIFDFVLTDLKQAYKRNPIYKTSNNLFYGIAAGITCAEVLLGIGWTVCSILIGIKSILPVSNFVWAIFAIACLICGSLFGLGMTLSKRKQEEQIFMKEALKKRNTLFLELIGNINNIFTQKIFYQDNNTTLVSPSIALSSKIAASRSSINNIRH